MTGHPVDPGLQPERTVLSWQRTTLALAAGSLVYARVAAQTLGHYAWLLAAAGLSVALAVWWRSRRRYAYHHRTLTAGTTRLADGMLPALLSGALTVAGVIVITLSLDAH